MDQQINCLCVIIFGLVVFQLVSYSYCSSYSYKLPGSYYERARNVREEGDFSDEANKSNEAEPNDNDVQGRTPRLLGFKQHPHHHHHNYNFHGPPQIPLDDDFQNFGPGPHSGPKQHNFQRHPPHFHGSWHGPHPPPPHDFDCEEDEFHDDSSSKENSGERQDSRNNDEHLNLNGNTKKDHKREPSFSKTPNDNKPDSPNFGDSSNEDGHNKIQPSTVSTTNAAMTTFNINDFTNIFTVPKSTQAPKIDVRFGDDKIHFPED